MIQCANIFGEPIYEFKNDHDHPTIMRIYIGCFLYIEFIILIGPSLMKPERRKENSPLSNDP